MLYYFILIIRRGRTERTVWTQIRRLRTGRLIRVYSASYPVQSTFVTSTSDISNNRLFRSENLVPVLTLKSNKRLRKYCGKEEKLLIRSNFSSFLQYFQYISNFRCQFTYTFVKYGCSIFFSVLQIRYVEVRISRSISESLGLRDNESRLIYFDTATGS